MNDVKEVYSDVIPSRDAFLICIKSKDQKKFRYIKLFLFLMSKEYRMSDYIKFETIEEIDFDIYAKKHNKKSSQRSVKKNPEKENFPYVWTAFKPKYHIGVHTSNSMFGAIGLSDGIQISLDSLKEAIMCGVNDVSYKPSYNFESIIYKPHYNFLPISNIPLIFPEESGQIQSPCQPNLVLSKVQPSMESYSTKHNSKFDSDNFDPNIHKNYNRINITKKRKKDKYNHG